MVEESTGIPLSVSRAKNKNHSDSIKGAVLVTDYAREKSHVAFARSSHQPTETPGKTFQSKLNSP